MSRIPLYLKTSPDMPRPGDSEFYLLTRSGLYFCRNHRWFQSDIPTKKPPYWLAEHRSRARWSFKGRHGGPPGPVRPPRLRRDPRLRRPLRLRWVQRLHRPPRLRRVKRLHRPPRPPRRPQRLRLRRPPRLRRVQCLHRPLRPKRRRHCRPPGRPFQFRGGAPCRSARHEPSAPRVA